jgi:hypothetical protein
MGPEKTIVMHHNGQENFAEPKGRVGKNVISSDNIAKVETGHSQDVPRWTLTNYDPAIQTKSSGKLVFNDFAANYAKQLTLADGL